MSEAVQLAIIGVVSSLTTGGIVVAIGAWAHARKVRADEAARAAAAEREAKLRSGDKVGDELAEVRRGYVTRIERLEERLDAKDAQIAALQKELTQANVTIARQEARIGDLDETVEGLRLELAECLGSHDHGRGGTA